MCCYGCQLMKKHEICFFFVCVIPLYFRHRDYIDLHITNPKTGIQPSLAFGRSSGGAWRVAQRRCLDVRNGFLACVRNRSANETSTFAAELRAELYARSLTLFTVAIATVASGRIACKHKATGTISLSPRSFP